MVTKVGSVQDALDIMILVAEFNAGYHYSNEAQADSIGEPFLESCVSYHGDQAKIWALARQLRHGGNS